jgi:hypothetical protein
MIERVNSTMMTYCKDFCKGHNVSPSTTTIVIKNMWTRLLVYGQEVEVTPGAKKRETLSEI